MRPQDVWNTGWYLECGATEAMSQHSWKHNKETSKKPSPIGDMSHIHSWKHHKETSKKPSPIGDMTHIHSWKHHKETSKKPSPIGDMSHIHSWKHHKETSKKPSHIDLQGANGSYIHIESSIHTFKQKLVFIYIYIQPLPSKKNKNIRAECRFRRFWRLAPRNTASFIPLFKVRQHTLYLDAYIWDMTHVSMSDMTQRECESCLLYVSQGYQYYT